MAVRKRCFLRSVLSTERSFGSEKSPTRYVINLMTSCRAVLQPLRALGRYDLRAFRSQQERRHAKAEQWRFVGVWRDWLSPVERLIDEMVPPFPERREWVAVM